MPDPVLPVGDLLVWEVVFNSELVNYAYRIRWHEEAKTRLYAGELPVSDLRVVLP
jgi:hypothetical protein